MMAGDTGKATRVLVLALCFGIGMAACTVVPSRDPSASVAGSRDPLEYYAWLKAAPEAELAEERRRLEAGAGEPSLTRDVGLAMLLSVTGGKRGDGASAEDILAQLPAPERVDAGGRAGKYLRLGWMWRDVLAQYRDLAESANEARNMLAEERMNTKRLKEENAALRQQIEALKSIEERINRRGRPGGGSQ